MSRATEAIRRHSPERTVFIDGLSVGNEPVDEMIDAGVAQSVHAYWPGGISHYRASWVDRKQSFPMPSWPLKDRNGKVTADRKKLEERYAPWAEIARKGVGVHCGECGCYNKTPYPIFMGWFGDVMDIFKQHGFGYALWNFRGSFGILDSGRSDIEYEDWRGHKLDRQLLALFAGSLTPSLCCCTRPARVGRMNQRRSVGPLAFGSGNRESRNDGSPPARSGVAQADWRQTSGTRCGKECCTRRHCANRDHQDLEWELDTWLRLFWSQPQGARVNHQINITPPDAWPNNYRIPDLVHLTPDRFGINRNEYFEGAPTVVVEIHSPGDEAYEKLPFYAELGVPEVWIIDRDTKQPEVYVLKKGQYHKCPAREDGWVSSDTTGICLRGEANGKLAIQLADDPETRRDLPEHC